MNKDIVKEFMEFKGYMCVPTVVRTIKYPNGSFKKMTSHYVVMSFNEAAVTIQMAGRNIFTGKGTLTQYINKEHDKCILDCIMSIFKNCPKFQEMCKSVRIGAPEKRASEVWDKYKKFDEKQLWVRFINKIRAKKEVK